MIELRDVCKKYGPKYALQKANFTIERGEIVGFLGQNGAGKSTALNIMTGYLAATSGTVLFDGADMRRHARDVRHHMGYMPEVPPLYDDMTVEEYLRFVCELRRVNRRAAKAHVERLCELTGLGVMRRRLVRNLSKGYRQRVGLASALAGDPEVLILDEHTAGLDPSQIVEIRSLIKHLGRNHTIILSSHILHDVSEVCEEIIIIHQGKILKQDSLSHLIAEANETPVFHACVQGDLRGAREAVEALEGVTEVRASESREEGCVDLCVLAQRGMDLRRSLCELFWRLEMPMLTLKREEMDLEDVFLRTVGTEKEA